MVLLTTSTYRPKSKGANIAKQNEKSSRNEVHKNNLLGLPGLVDEVVIKMDCLAK
ncbi:unnamed protein product, partial [Ceratitis capitata]